MAQRKRDEDTGYRYPDGSPVRVGDRIFIAGEERSGKVYSRPGRPGRPARSFVTIHYPGGSQRQYALSAVEIRARYYDDLKRRRGETAERRRAAVPEGGVYVVGPIDYDHLEIVSRRT